MVTVNEILNVLTQANETYGLTMTPADGDDDDDFDDITRSDAYNQFNPSLAVVDPTKNVSDHLCLCYSLSHHHRVISSLL